ncbi:alpha/beta fold hydrolase [Paenibacillus sp. LjRoot153]|uniref:alpha/beta hydrolase n=1 Tax=Paenibacillus sp. LjRoot153 TaxID=3342270 RepID=UPI003ECDEBF6
MMTSEIHEVKTPKVRSTTIMWLTGWSMSDEIFDPMRELLPDFHHISVDYSEAGSPEEMLLLTETAAENILSLNGLAPQTKEDRSRLLICGWSLGGLLALRLAAKGYGDGLVLFAANARFTRTKEETGLGWSVAAIRQMIIELKQNPQDVETKFRQNLFTEAKIGTGHGRNLPYSGCWTTAGLISGLQILRSEEVLSKLPMIDCPVLVVHGTEDKICPYNAALELVAGLPQAELLTIPYCGHVPFLDREAATVDTLRRWWHEH